LENKFSILDYHWVVAVYTPLMREPHSHKTRGCYVGNLNYNNAKQESTWDFFGSHVDSHIPHTA